MSTWSEAGERKSEIVILLVSSFDYVLWYTPAVQYMLSAL